MDTKVRPFRAAVACALGAVTTLTVRMGLALAFEAKPVHATLTALAYSACVAFLLAFLPWLIFPRLVQCSDRKDRNFGLLVGAAVGIGLGTARAALTIMGGSGVVSAVLSFVLIVATAIAVTIVIAPIVWSASGNRSGDNTAE